MIKKLGTPGGVFATVAIVATTLTLTSIAPANAQSDSCTGRQTSAGVRTSFNPSTNVTRFVGTSGADVIIGTSGRDIINGFGGNDVICAGAGNDAINGGNGHDTIVGGWGNDTITGGNGNDTISGGIGNDTISGLAGNDNLDGNSGNDTINGNGNNDVISGGRGADVLSGGDGDDRVNGNGGPDTMTGGNGSDTIAGHTGADTISGGAHADILSGGDGNDVIRGNDGADRILGGNGTDSLFGNDGRDTISGGTGPDAINGGGNGDTIAGGPGNDNCTVDPSDGHSGCEAGVPTTTSPLNTPAGVQCSQASLVAHYESQFGTQSPNLANAEARLLAMINETRAICDLNPLTVHPEADRQAQFHSQDMLNARLAGSSNFFQHSTRWRELIGGSIATAGENIALVSPSVDPTQIHRNLVASGGHLCNILSPNYDQIGLGFTYYEPSSNRGQIVTEIFVGDRNFESTNGSLIVQDRFGVSSSDTFNCWG